MPLNMNEPAFDKNVLADAPRDANLQLGHAGHLGSAIAARRRLSPKMRGAIAQ